MIVEEEEVSEEEDHEQVVQNFLKEINNPANPATADVPKKNEDRNHVSNTMALNDLRRAKGTKITGATV